MKQFLKKKWVVPIGALVLTLAIGSAAFAATGTSSISASGSTATSETGANSAATPGECDGTGIGNGPHGRGEAGQRSDETPLTGDELSKAQSAALAAPEVGSDATVMRAETDADGNGAYEVHVKKADGTMMTVYLDESFNVVTVKEAQMGGPRGGGEGRGQRSDETPLTGDELSKAQAAALAAPEVGSDATVMRAETDADGNGTYEVHVKKADGTMMTVYLDESFNVVKTEEGHAGGQHRGGMRERDGDGTAAPSTDPAETTAS